MSSINKKGKRAAILVENGFCERELVQAETALKKISINPRIISANTALVEGWNEAKQSNQSNWGQKYASHAMLGQAMPCDFEVLVIPGGIRSVDKLRQEKDLKSFISGFIATGKPVIVYNQAVDLLLFHEMTKGYSIAARDQMCDTLGSSGARCASKEFVVSKNLITLTRFRDAEEKIGHAVTSILNGEPYVEKVVSSDTVPRSHQAA